MLAESDPGNLDDIDGYYGPGTYIAWVISTIYVFHSYEWRVLYHAVVGTVHKIPNKPHKDESSSHEVVSVHLDISTLITMMYPIISNIYGVISLIRILHGSSTGKAETKKAMLQVEPVVIVAQVSMALTTPCLFWELVEDTIICERSSRTRLFFWSILWFSGFRVPCSCFSAVSYRLSL